VGSGRGRCPLTDLRQVNDVKYDPGTCDAVVVVFVEVDAGLAAVIDLVLRVEDHLQDG
jgi:hypothetical protein